MVAVGGRVVDGDPGDHVVRSLCAVSPVVDHKPVVDPQANAVIARDPEPVGAGRGELDVTRQANSPTGRRTRRRPERLRPAPRVVDVTIGSTDAGADQLRAAGEPLRGGTELVVAAGEPVDPFVVAGARMRHLRDLVGDRSSIGREPRFGRGPVAVGWAVGIVVESRRLEPGRVGSREHEILARTALLVDIPLGSRGKASDVGVRQGAEGVVVGDPPDEPVWL